MLFCTRALRPSTSLVGRLQKCASPRRIGRVAADGKAISYRRIAVHFSARRQVTAFHKSVSTSTVGQQFVSLTGFGDLDVHVR